MVLVIKNNILVDILQGINDEELEFYKTTIQPDAFYLSIQDDKFHWQLNQEYQQQLILYCNYLQQQINEQLNINITLDNRLKLIESLLINELLFSPTFGKEREKINVHFSK